MNKSDFAELVPFRFNERLILSLDSKWLNHFLDDNVKFSVSIKNEHLVLVGPKVTVRPTKRKHHHVEEDASVIA